MMKRLWNYAKNVRKFFHIICQTPHNVHHTLADLACTVMLIETTLTHNAYMPKSTPDCWCCQKWHKCTFLSVLGEPGLLLKFATDIAAGHKSWPRALQKWRNRSKCRLGANSCGPKKPCIRWRHGVQFCVDMSSNYPSRVVFKILYDSWNISNSNNHNAYLFLLYLTYHVSASLVTLLEGKYCCQ